jgi:hypothetical protein
MGVLVGARAQAARYRLMGENALAVASTVLQKRLMHATFFQKVIICAIAAFFAATVIEWGKVFIEDADNSLNAGYEHRTIMSGP